MRIQTKQMGTEPNIFPNWNCATITSLPATVHRKPVEELTLADIDALKSQIKWRRAPINAPIPAVQMQLLDFLRANPAISYDELAELTQKDRSTVMRNIGKLKDAGMLKRVGSRKTCHWEIIE